MRRIRIYTVHTSPAPWRRAEDAVFIKDGFCWPAFYIIGSTNSYFEFLFGKRGQLFLFFELFHSRSKMLAWIIKISCLLIGIARGQTL